MDRQSPMQILTRHDPAWWSCMSVKGGFMCAGFLGASAEEGRVRGAQCLLGRKSAAVDGWF